uniref:Plastocyanin-like domain-containing protein n=1 Tax=Brassica oleracea var. oleracea TaxID=109376 RepID=A0A0D3C1I4_BRAOL
MKYGAKEQCHLCVTYACMGIHVHSVDMNLLPHFPRLHYSISHLYLRLTLEDPYRFFTWTVTYGTRSPLGVPQQVILINGQFPGPPIEGVTNDNILVNLINKIDEPLLITWNGIKQRRMSWQDGVLGTSCPIQPNSNWTYHFQLKDQIGTYTYFSSTSMHRASGAFGALNVNQRSVIFVPYHKPDGDFTLLVSDWYKMGHKALRKRLDSGRALPLPDGLLINGASKGLAFTGEHETLIKSVQPKTAPLHFQMIHRRITSLNFGPDSRKIHRQAAYHNPSVITGWFRLIGAGE